MKIISEVFFISDYSATISQGELIFIFRRIYESVYVSGLYAFDCVIIVSRSYDR